MGLGHLLALVAIDEARRADRIATDRAGQPRMADDGLDPSRAEARANAWSRWIARRDDATRPDAGRAAPRRAAHV